MQNCSSVVCGLILREMNLLFYCSAMKLADPISAIGSSGHLDMPALVEWVNQNRLDPNDPANSTILYHVKVNMTASTKLRSSNLTFGHH